MANFINGIIFITGVTLGTVIAVVVIKKETSAKDKQIILQLQIENTIHRIEKIAVKTRLIKNGKHIQILFERDEFRENQILTCLEWLSEITRIRNHRDLETLILSTQRFRNANKPKDEDVYISE